MPTFASNEMRFRFWERILNILIVDDLEYDALELTTKLATIYPLATITWRSSPDRALADVTCIDAKSYDVVFVDQHMPGSFGTDLVKRFGELLDRKLTRVIMLTSDGVTLRAPGRS